MNGVKKGTDDLRQDVEDLTMKAVPEEALGKVWEQFESAMDSLDGDSRTLIDEYFRGTTPRSLSRRHGISEEEVETWISRAKRQLITNLRNARAVKQ